MYYAHNLRPTTAPTDDTGTNCFSAPEELFAASSETHNGRTIFVHEAFPLCVFQYEPSYESWDACVRNITSGPSPCYSSYARILTAKGNQVPLEVTKQWTRTAADRDDAADVGYSILHSADCNTDWDPLALAASQPHVWDESAGAFYNLPAPLFRLSEGSLVLVKLS